MFNEDYVEKYGSKHPTWIVSLNSDNTPTMKVLTAQMLQVMKALRLRRVTHFPQDNPATKLYNRRSDPSS